MNLEKCWFEVKNEEHSKAIQRRLSELGYVWKDAYRRLVFKHLSSNILAIEEGELRYGGDVSWFEKRKDYTKTTLDDLYKEEKEEPIKINEYIVEFKEDGIKVGCEYLSKDTVKEVWDRLNGKKEKVLNLNGKYFKVKNKGHAKVIQERLLELGYYWSSGENITYGINTGFINIGVLGKDVVNWSNSKHEFVFEELTLDDLYDVPTYEPIYIDRVKVYFTDDGIEVGHKKVSKETVQKIWERLNK